LLCFLGGLVNAVACVQLGGPLLVLAVVLAWMVLYLGIVAVAAFLLVAVESGRNLRAIRKAVAEPRP
jgi:hypothetical protein